MTKSFKKSYTWGFLIVRGFDKWVGWFIRDHPDTVGKKRRREVELPCGSVH